MITPIDDGGPAFPFKCQGSTTAPEFYYGMSLRDWFAGQVAAQCLHDASNITYAAINAYAVADAMIAARKGVRP